MTWRARPNGYGDGPQVPGSWCIHDIVDGEDRGWVASQIRGEGTARLMALAPEMARERDSLGRDVARLERTVGWLVFGLAVPMILLGLVVGLTLFT